jgi:hypothetical protein
MMMMHLIKGFSNKLVLTIMYRVNLNQKKSREK